VTKVSTYTVVAQRILAFVCELSFLNKFRFCTGIQKVTFNFSSIHFVFNKLLLKLVYFEFNFRPNIFLIVSLFLIELPNINKNFSLGQQEMFLV
jgi:hypothetical protein